MCSRMGPQVSHPKKIRLRFGEMERENGTPAENPLRISRRNNKDV